jgi:hypothetical protein
LTVASSSVATSPERAANFVSAIGVNIHTDMAGYAPKAIVADMAYLGLSSVRVPAIGQTGYAVAFYNTLTAAGLKFDWLAGGPADNTTAGLNASLAQLDAFLKANPAAISTIEGPNEVDNFPITFNGLTGTAAAVAYQQALYKALKANPLTASIPVLNFTGAPAASGPEDGANIHPYPPNGAQAMSSLNTAIQQVSKQLPGKPIYITEAGYAAMPNGVTPTVQAKLELNMIMDAAKLGVATTYLYDLIDDGANGSYEGNDYGLFSATNQANAVATAIHDLTSVLADTGASAATFKTAPLSYAISGLPSDGSSLLIEKSNGVYDLVIWAEPTIWTVASHSAVVAPTQTVTVSLTNSFAQVAVFDPLVSASAIAVGANINTVTLGVTDHPLIVQVSTFVQAMATFKGASDAVSLSHIAPAPSTAAVHLVARG